MARISNTHWLVNMPIAHRGLHDGNKYIPENSLGAFNHAIQNNYAIELDIVFTKDAQILVFHDYNTLRLCGLDSNVSTLTLPEIKTLRLCNTQEEIPTLQEVLQVVDGQVPLLIEIKNKGKVGHFENTLYELLKLYKGDYAIQSFNPRSLKWFSKQYPEVLRGHLASRCHRVKLPYYKRYISKNLLSVGLSKPDFVGYKIEDLPYKAVTKIRAKIPVLGWTINTYSKLDHAKLYCDNYIFEDIVISKHS